MKVLKSSKMYVLILLVVFCLCLIGCNDETNTLKENSEQLEQSAEQPEQSPEQPKQSGPIQGGILSVAYTSDPLILDSRINMATSGGMVAYQVQEGLLSADPTTGKIVPALAKEYNISDDGLVYTFILREGVKFHDGTEFDADDVLYTFSFLTGEREGGIYVSQFSDFIESVVKQDKYIVVITLTSPWSDFTTHLCKNWATLILSQEAVENAGENYGLDTMVGTGPFKFEKWVKEEPIVLVRNNEYWDQPYPYLGKVVFRPIKDSSARLLSAQAGEVDIVNSPPVDQLKAIDGNKELTVMSVPGNPMASIQINTADLPFNDIRLRQALYHALDREALTKAYIGNYAVVARDMLPEWHEYHDPNFPGVEYNPEKAKELLADAGYSESNPLKFAAITSTDTDFQKLLVFIQSQLLDYGIEMEILPLESAVRLATMAGADGFNRDDYDLSIVKQTLPGSTTDDYIYKFYGIGGTLNRMFYNQEEGYKNPEVEKKIHDARSSSNKDEQRKLYREIIEELCYDAALIPIFYEKNVAVVNTRVNDFYLLNNVSVPYTKVWVTE